MGAWNRNNKYAFRGDTMNSFGSIFGKEDKNIIRHFYLSKNGKNPENVYYEAGEYLELLEDFPDKSEEVIEYRTNKIIEALKEKLERL